MDRGTRLRALLREPGLIVAPGASTPLLARLVELAGFPVVYATGAGVANMNFGYPDVGLVGMGESLEIMRRINDAVQCPVIADVDNGFGNALMVYRTVRAFSACGLAGLQLEDQRLPKRCGHFSGKALVSTAEMLGKIRAARDAMLHDAVLVARTDAIAVEGVEAALERAHAYLEAGADMLFVEAPRTREELAAIPRRVPGLHIANMVEGGATPLCANTELAGMGYKLVLYANAPLKAALKGTQDLLAHLKAQGTTADAGSLMISMEERNRLTRLPEYRERESAYRVPDTTA